jgi:hypothetical protein
MDSSYSNQVRKQAISTGSKAIGKVQSIQQCYRQSAKFTAVYYGVGWRHPAYYIDYFVSTIGYGEPSWSAFSVSQKMMLNFRTSVPSLN